MKLDNDGGVMDTIKTKLTQSFLREIKNKPWSPAEKGIHLLMYERSLTWPKDRPSLLKDVIERIENNS